MRPEKSAYRFDESAHEGRVPVEQIDDYGCSVACAAFIAETDYATAEKARAAAPTLGDVTTTRGVRSAELVALLARLNVATPYRASECTTPQLLSAVADNEIVFVQGDTEETFAHAGHFLVRWAKKWMCPLRGFVSDEELGIDTARWIVVPAAGKVGRLPA